MTLAKRFLAVTSLLLSLLAPTPAYALHLTNATAGIDMDTAKIANIQGDIEPFTLATYLREVVATAGLPGDRILIINSRGGRTDVGDVIIATMAIEQRRGVRQVCVVLGEADSMAFNILTHCDVRLATRESKFLVHDIAYERIPPGGPRLTAKRLRALADELAQEDVKYRKDNAKALHLPLAAFIEVSEAETSYTTPQLRAMRYLHGVVKIQR